MALGDLLAMLFETLRTQRLRSALTMLGIVVGIAAVVLLSSIGEGTREGIVSQFSQFGTTIVGIQPGRQESFGGGPAVMGGTTRPLTVEDALALRRVPGVHYVAPSITGLGRIEAGERSRRTYLSGTVWEDQHVLKWVPRIGTFLPPGDPDRIPAVCVLGPKVASELFPGKSPLGERVRVGDARFTVVGVMSPKGQMLGFDLDDVIYLPIRRAMRMLNRDTVTEIHVLVSSHGMIREAIAGMRAVLRDRHDGEEDFKITSNADMLAVVDKVLRVLTGGVLVIAGISVLVGAMGILTILWVAVHERTSEIGLLKAIGASDRQIMLVFLAEAGALSLFGGLMGVSAALGLGWLATAIVPSLWFQTPAWVVPVAIAVSLGVGVLAGVVPATRAARLDPIDALRAE